MWVEFVNSLYLRHSFTFSDVRVFLHIHTNTSQARIDDVFLKLNVSLSLYSKISCTVRYMKKYIRLWPYVLYGLPIWYWIFLSAIYGSKVFSKLYFLIIRMMRILCTSSWKVLKIILLIYWEGWRKNHVQELFHQAV